MTERGSFEKRIFTLLRENGYEVFKNGWPDCLAIDSEDNGFLVEIKSVGDRLQDNQKKTLDALQRLGFNVFVVSESGLKKMKKKIMARLHEESETERKVLVDIVDNAYGTLDGSLDDQLRKFEELAIRQAMKRNNNKLGATSNDLGISFEALRYRMAKLKIEK